MSDVIDTNVVEIRFDNSQFIENVSQTIDSVNTLKEALVFDENSFDAINRASRTVDLSGITANIESLSERFSTFGIIGMTAIQRITNEVMTLAGKLGSLLTAPWRQIISGGTSRAENISNAQFQLQGIFGKTEEGARKLAMTMNADSRAIQEMTGYTEDMVVAMDAANYAVADTAYGLDSAAKAASVLATSGVDVTTFSEDLKDANGLLRTEMQVALRSISGTAAMANSSYDDIARIFERISGNGRIMAIDLQSLSSRGLNAAATLRDYLNEVGITANATEKDIREMVSKGQIDFMTFAKAMDTAYGDHAKDANNTFNGAFSNMKFALSKIGADFISPLRDKMIPILNDVRMVINNVRKALQFKIKFPGLEKEVSIVELFTRAITHLTEAAHDMFAVWMGGQDVITKAMTGLSSVTGIAFADVKKIFKEVENGGRSSANAIETLTSMAESHGKSLDEVYKTLSENLEKSEDEIREMCRNGEISFEDFSNAISSAFGNTVWDKRVQQLATIFRNVLVTAMNLANAVSSVVGPIIEAFINVFFGKGVNGIISFTEAMSELTSQIKLSLPAQKALRLAFQGIFRVLKAGLSIAGRLIAAAFNIVKALSPIIDIVLNVGAVLVEVVTEIIEFVAYSQFLNTVVNVLAKSLLFLARVAILVFAGIVSFVAPAVQIVANVFNALSKGIKSVKVKAIDNIISRFKTLLELVTDGTLFRVFKNVISTFIGAIFLFFYGIVAAFKNIGSTIEKICSNLSGIGEKIITAFKSIGEKVKEFFINLYEFMKEYGLKIVAIIETVVGLAIFGTLAKTSNALQKAVKAWANKTNAEAFFTAAKGIRQIAISFIILAGALMLLSLIDPDRLLQTLELFGAIAVGLASVGLVFYLILKAFGKLEEISQKTKTIEAATVRFMDTLSACATTLSNSAGKMMKRIGTGVMFVGLATFVIALAGAIYILYKALINWATVDWDTMLAGLERIGLIVALLTASMAILGKCIKGAGGGFMGAAIAMLALLAVLKGFEYIIEDYAHFSYNIEYEWPSIIGRIASSMIAMAVAVGILGATCKKAGFGLMGASLTMLSMLIVLKVMEGIIEDYATLADGHFIVALFKLAAVLGLFVVAIALMGDAFSGQGSSFSWRLKEGIKFKNDTIKFMGVVLTLLALAITLKVVTSVMKDIASSGYMAWGAAIGLLALILGGIIGLIYVLGDKKVSKAPLAALAGLMLSLAFIFSIMSLLDPLSQIATAAAIGLVLDVLAKSVKKLTQFGNGHPVKAILSMAGLLAVLGTTLYFLGQNDWQNTLVAALSLSTILAALVLALKVLKNATFRISDFAEMLGIIPLLLTLIGAVFLLSKIPVPDPGALFTLTICMTLLGGVATAAAYFLSMIPIADLKGIGAFAGILAIISFMSLLIAASAAIVGSTNSVAALWSIAGAMSALSIVIVAIVFALKLINANQTIYTGVGAFALLLATLSGFALLMSLFAMIGDVGDTVTLMNGLVSAMTSLIPFLLIFSVVTALVGQFAPLAAVGTLNFLILLTSLAAFAGILAWVTTIGNVDDTVTIMSALVETLNGLMGFLLVFSVVLALLGFIAPVAVAGYGSFAVLILTIGEFAALMSLVALIPADVNKTVTIMEAVSETLRSMTITILLLTAVAAMAPLAIAGITILKTFFVSMLLMFGIIGAIEKIQNAVITGVNLMLLTCSSVQLATEMMGAIDLNAIAIFLTAIDLLSQVNLASIAKVAIATVALLAVTAPLLIIEDQSKDILVGLNTALTMMTGLVSVFTTASLLGDIDVDDLANNTKKLLDVVKQMTAFSSYYIVAGLVEGMTGDAARNMLKLGCFSMASVIDYYFRQVMGIHSNSDWGIDIAKWIPGGIAETLESLSTQDLLGDATTSMANSIKEQGVQSFADAGLEIGKSFVTALGFAVGGGTSAINAALTEVSTSVQGKKNSNHDLVTQNRQSLEYWESIYESREKVRRQNMHDQDYRPYASANFNSTVGSDLKDDGDWWSKDWGNLFTDIFSEIEESMSNLGSFDDLTSGAENFGSALDSASSSADKLTSKIDDLMDEYENRFDTAKERANKDLFKGVDKQGDEFLDKIQDIMDEYKDIYTSAVEKTNSEDLFAEVKEDDESFAPETLLNNLEDQVNQVNELNTIISSLGGRIADNNLRAAISAMDVDDLPELRAMYRMSDSQLAEYEQMYSKKVTANQNKIQNELSGSLSQLTGKYTNIATYIADDATTNVLMRNLQQQVDQLTEYNATVASLMDRIKDVNLREAIAQMGVESLDELKTLNSMTGAELDQYVDLYNKKIGRGIKSVENELSAELSALLGQPIDIDPFYRSYDGTMASVAAFLSGNPEGAMRAGDIIASNMGKGVARNFASETNQQVTANSGKEIANSVATGLADKDVLDTIEKNAENILEKIKNVLDPSKTTSGFKEIGGRIVFEIAAGIDRAREDSTILRDAVTKLIDAICSGFTNYNGYQAFYNVGRNIVIGLRDGMNGSTAIATSAASSLAFKTLVSTQRALGIKSPSREFMKVGKFIDEGLAIGLKTYSNLAEDEAGNMANGTVSAVQDAITQLSGMLDGSIDVNPVITPTLDLSQVDAKSAALANMFNNRRIAVQEQNDAQQAEMISKLGDVLAEQNSEPKSLTFTQNNYSPKALDRTEIYRQSRNAFSQLANAVT